jgi:hypothetical protein
MVTVWEVPPFPIHSNERPNSFVGALVITVVLGTRAISCPFYKAQLFRMRRAVSLVSFIR